MLPPLVRRRPNRFNQEYNDRSKTAAQPRQQIAVSVSSWIPKTHVQSRAAKRRQRLAMSVSSWPAVDSTPRREHVPPAQRPPYWQSTLIPLHNPQQMSRHRPQRPMRTSPVLHSLPRSTAPDVGDPPRENREHFEALPRSRRKPAIQPCKRTRSPRTEGDSLVTTAQPSRRPPPNGFDIRLLILPPVAVDRNQRSVIKLNRIPEPAPARPVRSAGHSLGLRPLGPPLHARDRRHRA